MASTSVFPDGVDDGGVDDGAGHGRRASRRARALREGSAKTREARLVDGWPEWRGMVPVVSFMAFPAAMAVGIAATSGGWPKEVLYPLAALLGLYVAFSALRGVELVLACTLFYLPFSTTYVIPVAPGVNGTNMLLLLGLFASVLQALGKGQSVLVWPKGTFVVFLFAVLSAFSGFTVTLLPGGWNHLLYSEILSYKGWLDQFLFYFICLSAIRDVQTAKRVFVYLCIGSIILVVYSIPEMLDKMGRSTIDKSRIGGPHQQSNNFGGFVAYTLLPVVAVFVTYIRDLRFWLLVPYFLLAAKVLITTFSRGAYLAMAFGSLMAGYFRGRGFLAFWLSLALCFFLVVPGAIPESVLVRLDSITEEQSSRSQPEELDKSSQHRLILWRAAGKMIMEDPVLGKGFKGFMYLKGQYTEQDVHESDPHNMYLYVASQMGLPALALFLLILGWAFQLGRLLSRDPEDRFVRAIGIGGASATACYAAVCFFGSRAVNLEFTAYFWAYFVLMQILRRDQLERLGPAPTKRRRRGAAFASVGARAEDEGAGTTSRDGELAASAGTRRRAAAEPSGGARGVVAPGRRRKATSARSDAGVPDALAARRRSAARRPPPDGGSSSAAIPRANGEATEPPPPAGSLADKRRRAALRNRRAS